MTASKEERAYRRSNKKCTREEMKTRLLEDLIRKKIGLNNTEGLVKRETDIIRGNTGKNNSRICNYMEERRLVVNLMRRKLTGNTKICSILRKERTITEKALIAKLGGKTREFKRIVKDTRKNNEEMRKHLAQKNNKKVEWLEKKDGKRDVTLIEMSEYEREKYGMTEIFQEECGMKAENLKKPDVVCSAGEILEISENEKQVLALGPKFCVRKALSENDFEVELEECIAKIKWELMSQDEKDGEIISESDKNIMSILSDDEREEVEEWEEFQEASRRMVFQKEGGKFNYGRKRATDLKGNTMVVLPGQRKKFQDEANLEMLRAEFKGCFKEYVRKHCNDRGEQESNLTKGETVGLKSLKKRFKEGNIVILPTDKSGRFSIMSMDNYLKAGEIHTRKDEEVNMETIVKTQTELNGNVSMMIKFFKIGHLWNHVDRARKTMINKSLSLCPMYLTFKDHKGWTGEDGSPPPTRPIAGGNTGMNLHISEILSEIVEPIVDAYIGGNEIISTEDMKAEIEIINDEQKSWTNWSWWEGKTTISGEFICCTKCVSDEGEPLAPAAGVIV